MSNETLASKVYREAAMADEWPATVPTTVHGYLHTPNLPIGLTPCEAAAMGPHIWLKVGPPDDTNLNPSHTAHLTAENAWLLADQLRHLVANHYQRDARPGVAFVDPTATAPATLTEAVGAAAAIVAKALAATLPEATDGTLTVGIVDVGYTTADLDPSEYREAKDSDDLGQLLDPHASDISPETYVVEPDGTTHSLY